VGLVPHKVVFDHIAVGVTRAHNALREQREKEKPNNTIRLDPNMGY